MREIENECPEEAPLPISSLLLRLAVLARRGPIRVADIVAMAGKRAHAVVLAVITLPEALPLPVAGMSTILAMPLILLSSHMAVFGSDRGIPAAVANRTIPSRLVILVAVRAAAILKRIERLSRPRFQVMARQDRLLAIVCLLLAIVIALPIPFGNLPPAACLLAIALGMAQRDGVLVVTGLVGTALLAGASVYTIQFLARSIQAW